MWILNLVYVWKFERLQREAFKEVYEEKLTANTLVMVEKERAGKHTAHLQTREFMTRGYVVQPRQKYMSKNVSDKFS